MHDTAGQAATTQRGAAARALAAAVRCEVVRGGERGFRKTYRNVGSTANAAERDVQRPAAALTHFPTVKL